MKNKIFTVLFVMGWILVLIAGFIPQTNVEAQAGGPGCVDASGAPCTPTSEPSGGGGGGGGNGGGNQNPPSSVNTLTFTPTPTNTPLPLQANPTQDLTQNAPTIGSPTPTLQPVISNGENSEGGEWVGVCSGTTAQKFLCSATFAQGCENAGGTVTVKDENGKRYLTCTIPLIENPESFTSNNDGDTEGDEDWEEQCTWNICLGLSISCWMDGGTGVAYDDGQGGYIFSCDVPAESNNWPPFGFGVFIGVLAMIAIPTFIKMKRRPKTQTREHVLLAKQPANTTTDDTASPAGRGGHAGILWGSGGQGANAPSDPESKPKPKPTPPPSQPKPSAGTKGDFNSDGDVDGNDFNL